MQDRKVSLRKAVLNTDFNTYRIASIRCSVGFQRNLRFYAAFYAPACSGIYFRSLLRKKKVAGVIAVSDAGRRTIMINEEACFFVFGRIKGKKNPGMAAGQNSSIPAVKDAQSGGQLG